MSKATFRGNVLKGPLFAPPTKDDLRRLALAARAEIRERSQEKGLDRNGQAFKPYTPRYAAWKKKKGRPAVAVDLTFRGDMWRAFGLLDVRERTAMLGFLDPANQKKAEGLLKKRDFLGLTPAQEETLLKLLVEALLAKQPR